MRSASARPYRSCGRSKDGKGSLRIHFEKNVSFDTVDDYLEDYKSHNAAAREALLKAEVFVLTLGVNEVWKLRSDGSTFSRSPWRLSPTLVEQHVMSVDENVHELEEMLRVWRRYNPNIKLIISLSPVPLHATFRGDTHHVVTANSHSKATLRLAAEKFCQRNDNVFYFPSYEVVTAFAPQPWEGDQRHVSRLAVGRVMELFAGMFIEKESTLSEETAKNKDGD